MQFSFTILGSSGPTVAFLHEMQLQERTRLVTMWTSREALGHLDLLIIWTTWIFQTFGFLGEALGLLAIFFESSFGRNLGLMMSWDS